MKTNLFNKYKTGLVLSGGGARGMAHIGALDALGRNNWEIDIISGVSAGAIIGSLYAAGHSPSAILELMKEKNIFDYTSLKPGSGGLLSLSGMKKLLKDNLPGRFEDLKIPLVVAVTNLNKGRIEYIREGDPAEAVVASASIPVLFAPQPFNGQLYADGGVFDNLPASPIRKQASPENHRHARKPHTGNRGRIPQPDRCGCPFFSAYRKCHTQQQHGRVRFGGTAQRPGRL